MKSIGKFVFLVILLPWCCAINEHEMEHSDNTGSVHKIITPEQMETVLFKEYINFNGHLSSLSDIYGNIVPTLANFNPGDKVLSSFADNTPVFIDNKIKNPNINCAGGEYVERKLLYRETTGNLLASTSSTKSSSSPTITTTPYTSTAIAKVITFAMQGDNQAPPITVVMGDTKMGKSVTLAKIQYEIAKLKPKSWNIRIDLIHVWDILQIRYPLIWSNKDYTIDILFQRMLELYIEEDYRALFFNVLAINPKNIILLFDNLDHMLAERTAIIVPLIQSIAQHGITVVLTGRLHNVLDLSRRSIKMSTYEISDLTISEAEKYLSNIWKMQISKDNSKIPSISGQTTVSLDYFNDRLTDYVTAFTQALYQTSIMKIPIVFNALAKQFTRSEQYLSDEFFAKYPVGCLDYVLNAPSLPADINTVLQHVKLQKGKFYEEIVKNIYVGRFYLENMVDIYGPIALRQLHPDLFLKPTVLMIRHEKIAWQTIDRDWQILPLINVIDIGQSQVQFINREYCLFFATRFTEKLFRPEYLTPIEFFRKIFSKSQHRDFLEFLNLRTKFLHLDTINKVVAPSRELNHVILDNLLINGFDELIEVIFLNTIYADSSHSGTELYKYISSLTWNERETKTIFRTMQSTVKNTNIDIFVEKPRIRNIPSRLESLVDQEMVPTLRLLFHGKTSFNEQENFQNILRTAVTLKIPNLMLVRMIVDNIIPPIILKMIDFNALLYHTIDSTGNGCQRIANYLITLGANPQSTKVNGRTLLHAAVQWGSKDLLEYVINDLKVSIHDNKDASGRTVFATALDANPFTHFQSSDDWWSMMSYLVQHVKLSIPDKTVISNLEQFKIPQQDIDSPFFRLFLSSDNYHNEVIVDHNGQSITYNPIGPNDAAYKRYMSLTRTIHPRLWGLSPVTLSLRRHLLLNELYAQSPEISILEILIRYRGVDSLTIIQREHYRQTINFLIESNPSSFSTTVKMDHILKALVDNIHQLSDIDDLRYFLDCGLLQKFDASTPSKIYTMLKQHSNEFPNDQTLRTQSLSLQNRLIHPTVHLNSEIFNTAHGQHILMELLNVVRSIDNTGNNINMENTDLLRCLGFRRSRSIGLSQKCHITWSDVDQFNDVPNQHIINKIRVNSDNFLRTLAAVEYNNVEKARQLVDLLRILDNTPDYIFNNMITGNSRMIMRDVIQDGGWFAYRQKQRLTRIINDVWTTNQRKSSKLGFLLLSKNVAIYAAASLPLIRQIYGTIELCLQQHNDTDNSCLYASGALALSVTLPPLSFIAVKFMPWIVDKFSRTALDLMPTTMPLVVRENTKLLRSLFMRFGAQAAVIGINMIGVGFDLYNIISMSHMIDQCSQQGANCLSVQKIDYIISLSFSCISIPVMGGMLISGVGLVVGLVIGLTMMIIESFAFGLNSVFYYKNNYDTTSDENMRIFFRKMVFLSEPEDVRLLVKRTDRVNYVYQHIKQLLEDSPDSIVAYGIGLGTVKENSIKASIINMNDSNLENTMQLSRVLPTNQDNTTLLCLPRQNPTEIYDKFTKNVTSAVYYCNNALVIAHAGRWKTKSSVKSYIIYDLEYIESGRIIGSDTLNNLFLISQGTTNLEIFGGAGNIVNKFMIKTDTFYGSISISSKAHRNILDLSQLIYYLHFDWASTFNNGVVNYGNDKNASFYLMHLDSSSPNLHVIGRTDKSEKYSCNYSNYRKRDANTLISIDGGGGESLTSMDIVIDCKTSQVRPFTHIIGSDYSNLTYVTHINNYPMTFMDNRKHLHATIEPKQSNFLTFFNGYPLFASIYSVRYIQNNKTLIWKLQYTADTILFLSIQPYRSARSESSRNSSINKQEMELVHCTFIDSYLNITIFPVLTLLADEITTEIIKNFNVFGTVNSTRMEDVIAHYRVLSAFYNEDLHIVTKLLHTTTNESFIFGSDQQDRFYVDANTMFLFGGDGSDIYLLNKQSSRHVRINNEANDEALDTLVIADNVCDTLIIEEGSTQSTCCDTSPYDLTLICSVANNTKFQITHLVLHNYLLDSNHRHLQIYWHDAIYIVLNDYEDNNNKNDKKSYFALLFYFDNKNQSTTLTLMSNDRYIAINYIDETNPIVAYKSKHNDIVLARKYVKHGSSSFIILQDFFTNGTNIVASAWRQAKFFIIDNNSTDYHILKTLTANDIRNLYIKEQFNNVQRTEANDNFIQEYVVNITKANINETIIIQHNNNSVMQR